MNKYPLAVSTLVDKIVTLSGDAHDKGSTLSVRRRFKKDQAKPIVAKKTSGEKPAVHNEISDDTGQYDMRFLLWRLFCEENGLAVATMPGDLEGDIREKWEKLKQERLHKKG